MCMRLCCWFERIATLLDAVSSALDTGIVQGVLQELGKRYVQEKLDGRGYLYYDSSHTMRRALEMLRSRYKDR